jgi:hypothetical protein
LKFRRNKKIIRSKKLKKQKKGKSITEIQEIHILLSQTILVAIFFKAFNYI